MKKSLIIILIIFAIILAIIGYYVYNTRRMASLSKQINETYEAYKVSLNWEYEKDNKYDKKGIVTLIKKDNKLYVVTYEGVKEQ